MKKLMMTVAFAMAASTAFAETVAEQVIAQLQEQGFTRIEVKNGISQVKVEAYRDGMQFEAIYDLATGQVLKQSFENATDEDGSNSGVEIRDEDRDFTDEQSGSHSDDDGDEIDDDGDSDHADRDRSDQDDKADRDRSSRDEAADRADDEDKVDNDDNDDDDDDGDNSEDDDDDDDDGDDEDDDDEGDDDN